MRHINLIAEYHTISATGPQSGAPEERGQGWQLPPLPFFMGQWGKGVIVPLSKCHVMYVVLLDRL